MERIEGDQQAAHFWQLPAVDILRQVWIQQFRVVDGQLIWRVENQSDRRSGRITTFGSEYQLPLRFRGTIQS